jgi:hypothetical protein
MIPFAILSFIITPPLLWLLLFSHLETEGDETLGEVQRHVLKCTLKHPFTWIWAFVSGCIVAIWIASTIMY